LATSSTFCCPFPIESLADLCSLLPVDTNDFIIHPPVDLDVVEILERMQSSRLPPKPQILPGDNLEPVFGSIDASETTSSEELPCPGNAFDAPEDEIHFGASFDRHTIEIVELYPAQISFNVQIISSIPEDQ
jgi:hypothetical protein